MKRSDGGKDAAGASPRPTTCRRMRTGKAPLGKGSCRANARLRGCGVHYNPTVIFLRKCHLPLHRGGKRQTDARGKRLPPGGGSRRSRVGESATKEKSLMRKHEEQRCAGSFRLLLRKIHLSPRRHMVVSGVQHSFTSDTSCFGRDRS